MAKYKIGDIVRVFWYDAVSFANVPLSKVKVPKVENVGKLVIKDKEKVVLQTGIYRDETLDPDGFWFAVSTAMVSRIELIKKGDI